MSHPKISIITPVYNKERYIRDCLNSVAQQTLCEHEHICVVDASPAGEAEIIREFSAANPEANVRLLVKGKNVGAAQARNAALDMAEGEYVFFLDADDMLDSADSLSALYEAAKTHNAEAVGGWTQDIDADGNRSNINKHELPAGDFVFSDYQYDWSGFAFLYSRELIGSLRLPDYNTCEDVPFCIQVLAKAKKLHGMECVIMCYRQGDGTPHKSGDTSDAALVDLARSLKWQLDFARENGFHKLYERIVSWRITNSYFDRLHKAYYSSGCGRETVLALLGAINDDMPDDKTLLWKAHYIVAPSRPRQVALDVVQFTFPADFDCALRGIRSIHSRWYRTGQFRYPRFYWCVEGKHQRAAEEAIKKWGYGKDFPDAIPHVEVIDFNRGGHLQSMQAVFGERVAFYRACFGKWGACPDGILKLDSDVCVLKPEVFTNHLAYEAVGMFGAQMKGYSDYSRETHIHGPAYLLTKSAVAVICNYSEDDVRKACRVCGNNEDGVISHLCAASPNNVVRTAAFRPGRSQVFGGWGPHGRTHRVLDIIPECVYVCDNPRKQNGVQYISNDLANLPE